MSITLVEVEKMPFFFAVSGGVPLLQTAKKIMVVEQLALTSGILAPELCGHNQMGGQSATAQRTSSSPCREPSMKQW